VAKLGIKLPYLFAPRAKGKTYYYYRRAGQRLRILDDARNPLDPRKSLQNFIQAYDRIHASFEENENQETRVASPGSLADLITTYKEAPEYKKLKQKTKKDYARHLDALNEEFGDLHVAGLPRDVVFEIRDRLSDTPRQADYRVSVLKRIMNFAIDRPRRFGVTSNPATKVPRIHESEGHRPWEETEIEAFRKCWKIDTVERLAFEIALNTGQRGGDIIKMARGHFSDGSISVVQEKTKQRVWVPASNDLLNVLVPWLASHKHAVILVTCAGKGFLIDHFRHTMRDAYTAAGLPADCTTHGLRYSAATRLRELGLDWEEIGSITGHATAEMVGKYTAKRRRAELAIARLNTATQGRKENKN